MTAEEEDAIAARVEHALAPWPKTHAVPTTHEGPFQVEVGSRELTFNVKKGTAYLVLFEDLEAQHFNAIHECLREDLTHWQVGAPTEGYRRV